MSWSVPFGISIKVPSDVIPGDGRNYLVIGEDVPDEIAADMAAAIIFHNASSNLSEVRFWALGISSQGSLEMVAYYEQTVAGDLVDYIAETMFSLYKGGSVDSLPILALGNYGGTYRRRGVGIVTSDPISVEGSESNVLGAVVVSDGRGALAPVGVVPPMGQMGIVQSGTNVLRVDAASHAYLTFPTPFPNGLKSFVPSVGDVAGGLRLIQTVTYAKDRVRMRLTNHVDGSIAGADVRVTWIATGW